MIFETIITTVNLVGEPHIAPFGIQYVGDLVEISPYKPSLTLDNILATKAATLNITDDVRVFAAAITDKINAKKTDLSVQNSYDIKLIPLEASIHAGYRLAHALSHTTLRLIEVKQDVARPTLLMQKVATEQHATFIGFNRAQAAVIELCVLASRLHLLPKDKILAEMIYLQIAIDKTAGERELDAWGWLIEKIESYYKENAAAH